MKLPEWPDSTGQWYTIGKKTFSVARIIELAKSLPVQEMPIDALFVDFDLTRQSKLREIAAHFKAVMKANLDYPIILDEDGNLIDGRHRIVKALVEGAKTIKFVKFDMNPNPDSEV